MIKYRRGLVSLNDDEARELESGKRIRESRLRLQKLLRLAQEFLAEVHNVVANGKSRLTIPIRESTHQNARVRFLASSGVIHSPKEALAGRNLLLIAAHNVLYVRLSERPSLPRSRGRTGHFCAFAWLSPLYLQARYL